MASTFAKNTDFLFFVMTAGKIAVQPSAGTSSVQQKKNCKGESEMTRTEIVMQAMTHDELDALIRDAEAERERRKVKVCVRRMEVGNGALSSLRIDGVPLVAVWEDYCQTLNIDHATAKRQIALAFCMADWVTRASDQGHSRICLEAPLHYEFCWIVREIHGLSQLDGCDEAARAAGWIK